MGQRHMTYVIVENVSKDCYRARVSMLALYNQWNFETIQPVKATRFLAALKVWQKNNVLVDIEDIAKLYKYSASISPQTLSRFHVENENYDKSYGMYDEDNNNGWQIVYIKYDNDFDKHKRTFKVHIGFKPGNEWGNDHEEKGYLSVKDYLDGCLGNYSGDEGYNYESFLEKHTKKEQALLKRLNKSFDAKEIERAERLIEEEIEKIVARKAKKAA